MKIIVARDRDGGPRVVDARDIRAVTFHRNSATIFLRNGRPVVTRIVSDITLAKLRIVAGDLTGQHAPAGMHNPLSDPSDAR
jgi:hypothetical protein